MKIYNKKFEKNEGGLSCNFTREQINEIEEKIIDISRGETTNVFVSLATRFHRSLHPHFIFAYLITQCLINFHLFNVQRLIRHTVRPLNNSHIDT